MKTLIALFLLAAPAAHAGFDTYICKNRLKPGVFGGTQYTVTVKEIANVKDPANKYDYVRRVALTVTAQPRGAAVRPYNIVNGYANAYIEDVVYRVVSKDLGVSMIQFLDEMDEARITIYKPGSKLEIPLVCDYKEQPKI